jgi:hypothetical protein
LEGFRLAAELDLEEGVKTLPINAFKKKYSISCNQTAVQIAMLPKAARFSETQAYTGLLRTSIFSGMRIRTLPTHFKVTGQH